MRSRRITLFRVHPYLVDTRYAVEHLTALIEHEYRELEPLRERATAAHRAMLSDETSEEERDLDPRLLGAWFGAEVAAERATAATDERLSAENKLRSLRALAGALLQIAQQGIAIAGGLDATQPGRMIGHTSVRDLVWYARNQAMHWEDGDYSRRTRECFELLAAEAGRRFDLQASGGENLALEVVRLLEWHSFEAFARDLEPILDGGGEPPTTAIAGY